MATGPRVYYPRCRAVLHLIFDGFADVAEDSEEIIVPTIPVRATVHLNPYKQADSYELTFDADDLGDLDPELIRSGAADIYLFQARTLHDEDFVVSRQYPTAQDTTGFLPRDPNATIAYEQDLTSAIERWTLGNRPIVAGLFDEPHLELGSGGRWVTVTGQDYTAYLCGRQWPPNGSVARRIPVGKRLDVTIAEMLHEADPRGRLRLVIRGIDPSDLPTVGAADVNGHARGIPVDTGTSYWDVMYKTVTRHGLIIFVDGLDVVIARPANLHSAHDTQIRKLAWGKNIDSLDLSRRIGRETSPTIVVQGYDPTTKKIISRQFPSGDRRITKGDAKKAAADVTKATSVTKIKAPPKTVKKPGQKSVTVHDQDEYQIIPLYGITDPKILELTAETLHNLLGRAERRCIVRTNDLRDLDESDLLGLRSGAAIAIDFQDYNRALLENPDVSDDAKVGHLLARGYGATIARTVVKHYAKLQSLRQPLKVREATFTYGVGRGEGVSIELELINFVTINGQRQPGDPPDPHARRDTIFKKRDGKRVGYGSSHAVERVVFRGRRR